MRLAWIAGGVAAIGVGALAIRGSSNGTSGTIGVDSTPPTTLVTPTTSPTATSAADTTTVVPTTVLSATTVVATTVVPTTVVPTTVVPTTVAALASVSVGSVLSVGPNTLTVASVSLSGQRYSGTAQAAVADLRFPVTFTYTNANEWSYQVAAGATASVNGTSVAVSGSVVDAAAVMSGIITMSVSPATPVRFGPSSSVSGTFRYSPAATSVPVFTGAASARLGSNLQFAAFVSYTSAGDWSITPAQSTATVALTDTIQLPLSALSGAISSVGGSQVWGLTATLSAPTDLIALKIGLSTATVTFTPNCPTTTSTKLCSGSVFMLLDGTLSAKIGGPVAAQSGVRFTATENLDTRAFTLDSTFDTTVIAEFANLTISTLRLAMSVNDNSYAVLKSGVVIPGGGVNGGFNIQVIGEGRMALPFAKDWKLPNIVLTYVNGGLVVAGDFAPHAVGPGSVSSFAYFDAEDTLATVMGNTITVPKRSYVFGAVMAMPAWLQAIGMPDKPLSSYMTYTSNGSLTLSAVIPEGVKLPSFSKDYTFVLTNATLSVTINPNPAVQTYTFTLAENGLLTISGASGNVKDIAIRLAMSYDPSVATTTFSVSANGLNGAAVWPNVMGVPGLDLNGFAISGQLWANSIPVGVGLAGSGTLPASLRQAMGINSTDPIPVSFVANVSLSSPCLDVSIGTVDGTTPVISIGGAVTATYAHFYASPLGCTVGTYVVPAGFSMTFHGAILKVPVDFNVTVNTNTPMTLKGNASIGGFTANGFTMDNVTATFVAGGYQLPHVGFAGGIRLNGVNVAVAGDATVFGFTLTGSAMLNIAGFNLDSAVTVKGYPGPILYSVQSSSSLDVGGLKVKVITDFGVSLSNLYYNGTGSISFPVAGSTASLAVSLGMDVLGHFNANAAVSIPLGGAFGSSALKLSTSLIPSSNPAASLNLNLSAPISISTSGFQFNATVGFIVANGVVSPAFDADVNVSGFTFPFRGIPIDNNWGFSRALNIDFAKSNSVGDKWGGLSASFSGVLAMTISSSAAPSFASWVKADLDAGYLGKWHGWGSVAAPIPMPELGKFCVSKKISWDLPWPAGSASKTFSVCVP